MKRYIIILVTVMTLAIHGHSQNILEYRVVKVVGMVENPVSGKPLKTGDLIPSNSRLKFASKDAYIIIASPDTGRKKISGVPDDKSRELFELLQSFVQPEFRSTASRFVSFEYLENLQESLNYDTLLLLSPAYIAVNTKKLSLDKPAVIRAWYPTQGGTKKVHYRKVSDHSGFHLDKKALFGDTIPSPYPRVIVEYFEKETEDPQFSPGLLIASFVPLYIDESALSHEIRTLISTLPADTTYSQAVQGIRGYIAEEYANAQEDNLKHWLKEKGILSE